MGGGGRLPYTKDNRFRPIPVAALQLLNVIKRNLISGRSATVDRRPPPPRPWSNLQRAQGTRQRRCPIKFYALPYVEILFGWEEFFPT